MSKQQLTDPDFAARVGVSAPQVNRWRNGRNVPELWRVTDLAAALGCTEDEVTRAIQLSWQQPRPGPIPRPKRRAPNDRVRRLEEQVARLTEELEQIKRRWRRESGGQ